MKKFLGLILIFASAVVIALPLEKAKIDEQKILKYISQLADDGMEGRKSGERSGQRAEEFIAQKFQELGLKPGGESGTYFQKFTFPMTQTTNPGGLRLVDGEKTVREYRYGDDYYFFPVSGSGHVRAEVVFIGYGFSRPDKGLDEYKNLDVEGKILLCLSGAPGGREKWDQDWTDYYKADQAIKHNALGLLIFDPGDNSQNLARYRIWAFDLKRLKKGLLFSRVGKAVIDDVLKPSGQTLNLLKSTIDTTLAPQSFRTGVKMNLWAGIIIDTEMEAANVMGMIPGSDPDLSDEIVIISGHYDGGGKDPDGVIYNGANDNASGIGVLLEIARVMMDNRVRPRRGILFIGWGAEEQGAWGSKHFIDHPPVPLGKIASLFVLDCVGLGKGEFWLFGAGHFVKVYEEIKNHIDPALLEGFQPREEAGSDQYYFQQKEVPSFFAHNIRESSNEHTPQDDVESLNPTALKKAARLVYEAALYMANKKE